MIWEPWGCWEYHGLYGINNEKSGSIMGMVDSMQEYPEYMEIDYEKILGMVDFFMAIDHVSYGLHPPPLSALLAGNCTARKWQNFSQKVKKSKSFRLFEFSNFWFFRLFGQKSPGLCTFRLFDFSNFSTFRLFEIFGFFDFFDFSGRNPLDCALFDFSNFSIFRIFRLFGQK